MGYRPRKTRYRFTRLGFCMMIFIYIVVVYIAKLGSWRSMLSVCRHTLATFTTKGLWRITPQPTVHYIRGTNRLCVTLSRSGSICSRGIANLHPLLTRYLFSFRRTATIIRTNLKLFMRVYTKDLTRPFLVEI